MRRNEKIPKKIVEKIELRNRLNQEISEWLLCDQHNPYEDWYYGNYYWETEVEGKYLKMPFDC